MKQKYFLDIKNTLNIIHGGNYSEIRMLKVEKKGTVSGYYDDYSKLESDLSYYNGKVNIFMTLNEVNPDVVARANNHLKEYSQHTTGDAEIIRRKWILIDIDPERPSGVSSNDAEVAEAEKVWSRIINDLDERGFSEGIKAFSGNGYHYLLPIDMENDQEATYLIKSFLNILDTRFSTQKAKVDTSTYNAARICKLYGTIACKGDSTEERPHRQSYIISKPNKIVPVSKDTLKEFVEKESHLLEISKIQKKTVAGSRKTSKVSKMGTYKGKYKITDVKTWLEEKKIEIDHEKPYDAGSICYVLKQCPWNDSHTDKSAYVIQFPNHKIVAGCHHDSCRNQNWETLLQLCKTEESESNSRNQPYDGEGLSITEIILKEIQISGHTFFHDKSGNTYVKLSEEFVEFLPLYSDEYKQRIRHILYSKYKKTVGKDSLQQVLDTLESQAIFDGEELEVNVRCKLYQGSIYYDIGDKERTIIRIDKEGYHVCEYPPIPFIRKKAVQEQVMPKQGGILQELTSKHWKFQNESDKILHDILIVSRFITDIPNPILIYTGEQGGAKTTSMKLDKMLIDPTCNEIKALPKKASDLVSALSMQYMVCFDNIDSFDGELTDIFCIASTGGVYTKRKLYSDNDEHAVSLETRLSFSCINMPSNRPDFYDRSICLSLRRISPSERKTSKEVMQAFEADKPYLLGAIFDVLSKAIAIYDTVNIEKLPRMADFAKWGYAIAEVLGYGGENFLEIYQQNQCNSNLLVLEEDALANAVISYMSKIRYFKGSLTELFNKIALEVGKSLENNPGMKSANAMSRRLNELQSNLEQVDIHFYRGKSNGKRYIEMWMDEVENKAV